MKLFLNQQQYQDVAGLSKRKNWIHPIFRIKADRDKFTTETFLLPNEVIQDKSRCRPAITMKEDPISSHVTQLHSNERGNPIKIIKSTNSTIQNVRPKPGSLNRGQAIGSNSSSGLKVVDSQPNQIHYLIYR